MNLGIEGRAGFDGIIWYEKGQFHEACSQGVQSARRKLRVREGNGRTIASGLRSWTVSPSLGATESQYAVMNVKVLCGGIGTVKASSVRKDTGVSGGLPLRLTFTNALLGIRRRASNGWEMI